MLNYIKSKTGKSPAPPTQTEEPVLTREDEEFLQRITSEANLAADVSLPPSPPSRPQSAHDAGSGDVEPLAIGKSGAERADTKNEFGVHQEPSTGSDQQVTVKERLNAARSKWTWGRKDSRSANRKTTASDLMSAAENVKPTESDEEPDEEAQKEANDMAAALETLNLAAVDNKVFSISKETRDLLAKFVPSACFRQDRPSLTRGCYSQNCADSRSY